MAPVKISYVVSFSSQVSGCFLQGGGVLQSTSVRHSLIRQCLITADGYKLTAIFAISGGSLVQDEGGYGGSQLCDDVSAVPRRTPSSRWRICCGRTSPGPGSAAPATAASGCTWSCSWSGRVPSATWTSVRASPSCPPAGLSPGQGSTAPKPPVPPALPQGTAAAPSCRSRWDVPRGRVTGPSSPSCPASC